MKSSLVKKETLTLSFFKATEQLSATALYYKNLKQKLIQYDVEEIILKDFAKTDFNKIYVLVILDTQGQQVGGIRLELKSNDQLLPVEMVFSELNISISDSIENFKMEAVAELSGLWVADNYNGLGIAERLIQEITSRSCEAQSTLLLAFPPLHTQPIFSKLGYSIVTGVSQLPYPNENYVSTLMCYFIPQATRVVSVGSSKPSKPLGTGTLNNK